MRRLFRSALHEHAEPAQRVLGVAQLLPDSAELAQMLAADPAPEVRAAAAGRCADLTAIDSAWKTEADPAVRTALAAALGRLLADGHDQAVARAILDADTCNDQIRADVAHHAADAERRQIAIAAIRDETALVALALAAGHAQTRKAAAERVQSADALRKLADSAKSKDRGVARLARQRVDAIEGQQDQETEADAILSEMEALAQRPGPILSAAVELDRRWRALDLTGDSVRLARRDAAHQLLQERFGREQEEQRKKTRFERRIREWIIALAAPSSSDALAALRTEHAALDAEAQDMADDAARAHLMQAASRFEQWEQDLRALAAAEALVVEAEQLAAGTFIDNANLPQRWEALERAIRTAALTQRFDAAIAAIEQRRLAQIRAAQHEANAVQERVLAQLHAAEQALADGQLQAARAAFDEFLLAAKVSAGALPKAALQRRDHVAQQLLELERWASFGQHNARVQLCERAEALLTQKMDLSRLAADVRKLRDEWKALDQQHADVPKRLWERFDSACEKAYAPAAEHFAQQAAQRKAAREKRQTFIAAAAGHASSLLAEPHDWRAIEQWLRDTDRAWRDGALGGVDPGAFKTLDRQFNSELAPLRDALSAARGQAKSDRQQLIAEVMALASHAATRDTPARVKAIQARWQEQAKAMPLPQREERPLWEQFRSACDSVFSTRTNERKAEVDRRQAGRRALEEVCAQIEQLARAADKDDQDIRRSLHELKEQWNKASAGVEAVPRDLELRFGAARKAIDTVLSSRVRAREAAVWQTLAAKERLCEELDGMILARLESAEGAAADSAARVAQIQEQWSALPALPTTWEAKVAERRGAALHALTDESAAEEYSYRIEDNVEPRREGLVQLEMTLGLETPAEFQAQRLAVRVSKLRERFKNVAVSSAGTGTPTEQLVAWCGLPGVANEADRRRCEKVFAALERQR